MNRNTEIHFAELPAIDIGRSKFDRSHTKWSTVDAGRLYPMYVDCTIMPGDTVKMRTSELIRMMTPVAPVMDDCFADITAWFVPHRLVWDHFKRFMGENDTAPWTQQTEYEVPQIIANYDPQEGYEIKSKSLADYLGYVPFATEATIQDDSQHTAYVSYEANALPIRAYNLIWNEFWRDENLQNPVNVDTSDYDRGVVGYDDSDESNDDYVTNSTFGGLKPLKVCKVPDYFTMCLPAPQKGPAVSIPMMGTAPVEYGRRYDTSQNKWIDSPFQGKQAGLAQSANSATYSYTYTEGTSDAPTKFADGFPTVLLTDLSEATGATINALRQAFAIQKFYERQARGGSRYIEMVKSHYGVTNPDFRLQRPEYLGGHRTLINMNQVVATTAASSQPLGDTGAYSVTQNTDEDLFTHSFTEHGTLMILLCIRQRHSYTQGLNRQLSMKKLTDFYFPEFANLGEQAVLKKEIYLEGGDNLTYRKSTDEQAFGYQEAWAHYRYFPDQATAEMRPTGQTGLGDVWTYTDYYTACPSLGDKWIEETKNNIQRTLSIQNHDQFMVNMYFGAIYTRPMPLYSIPGLIDHH